MEFSKTDKFVAHLFSARKRVRSWPHWKKEIKSTRYQMDDMRKGGWIETFTGGRFYVMDPRIEEVNLRDIAHSLSLQVRFNGHCREFYSIAQHSVLVSAFLERYTDYNLFNLPLIGLLHDGSEAYTSDIPAPTKPYMPEFQKIENLVQDTVYDAFSLPNSRMMPKPYKDILKYADMVILATEVRDLGMNRKGDWNLHPPFPPLEDSISPLNPKDAFDLFMYQFESCGSWEMANCR